MAAITRAAFDPIPKYLEKTVDAIAGAAILAGDVVAFNATGVDFTVQPANGTTTYAVLGVALHSQATVGGHVSVASVGSILKVKNADDTTAIGSGVALQAGVSTATGCVIAAARGAASNQIGVAIEAIAGNGTGYALITSPVRMNKGA